CSDNNEVEAQEGTDITDVKCKPKRKRYGLIGVPAIGILLSVFYLVHGQANESGVVVYKDCSDLYSTSCKPCSKGTYMNEPNGHRSCFQCKTCGRAQGLSILQDCTTIQDTICEALDGYYCLDYKNRECIRAVEHSKCTPGQYIKTSGTKASDTVCEACPPGFYSPKGVNCIKWTDCSDNNEVEAQEGTDITDVKCKPKRKRYGLIGVLVIGILLSVFYLVHGQANKS
ncbi:tumor necrosis factor receptor superfamily member 5-like isoform X1, partial [Clarias magur]